MGTLVVVLVLAAVAASLVALAGGFDRRRVVRYADPVDDSRSELVRERTVVRERPVVRETVVERDLR
jgi:hypothetical protein